MQEMQGISAKCQDLDAFISLVTGGGNPEVVFGLRSEPETRGRPSEDAQIREVQAWGVVKTTT